MKNRSELLLANLQSKMDVMSASMKNNKTKEGTKVSPLKYTPASSASTGGGSGKNRKRKRPEEDAADSTNKKPKRVLKVRCASKRVKT